jgi:hypothetical protein
MCAAASRILVHECSGHEHLHRAERWPAER